LLPYSEGRPIGVMLGSSHVKDKIKNVIEESESRYGRLFAFVIQALIVVSLITFSIDTIPDISDQTRYILSWLDILIVSTFTLEYITRVIVADHKWKFIFSFFGLIDLIAILPFYIASGLDLRAVRAFRLLRLVRIFKLFRYNQAARRFYRALIIVKEELILFGFVTLILLYLAAVGIYYFEHQAQPDQFKSVFHCLWWAIITLTTVGYGDMYPITVGGKIFTFFILLIGLGIIAVPTGLMASALSQARSEGGK